MKRPNVSAQRLRDCEAENQRLRGVITALAGKGLIVPDQDAIYNAGYRKGHNDALQTYRAGMRQDYLQVQLPITSALMNLSNSLAGAAVFAALVGLPRADMRDALRPLALQIADNIRARFQAVEEKLAKVEDTLPPDAAQQMIGFYEALRTFGLGRDNGEALAASEAIQLTFAGEIHATLSRMKMGGPRPSEPRAWIGQRITEQRQRSEGLTYAVAAERLYRELIERQRAHELLEIEERALTELDTRANGVFRDFGNCPPAVVSYCKRAAEDWRARGHELRT